jgi:hypothetical protein
MFCTSIQWLYLDSFSVHCCHFLPSIHAPPSWCLFVTPLVMFDLLTLPSFVQTSLNSWAYCLSLVLSPFASPTTTQCNLSKSIFVFLISLDLQLDVFLWKTCFVSVAVWYQFWFSCNSAHVLFQLQFGTSCLSCALVLVLTRLHFAIDPVSVIVWLMFFVPLTV